LREHARLGQRVKLDELVGGAHRRFSLLHEPRRNSPARYLSGDGWSTLSPFTLVITLAR
jgi:hypothetical protein